jgi:hypothetical protein
MERGCLTQKMGGISMGPTRTKIAVAGALVLATSVSATAFAGGPAVERATLNGLAEVPTLSTPGAGTFRATVNTTANRINYTLRFNGLGSPVQQAHIHLGRTATSGGISAFLCSNLAGAPAGAPNCPAQGGMVSQVIRPAEVQALPDQALGAGQFGRLVRAIRAGATYVNVHTVAFTGGAIRGQIR